MDDVDRLEIVASGMSVLMAIPCVPSMINSEARSDAAVERPPDKSRSSTLRTGGRVPSVLGGHVAC